MPPQPSPLKGHPLEQPVPLGARLPSIWVGYAEPIFDKEGVMADGFVHTVHRDGAWRITIEGDDNPLPGSFTTKDGAVQGGRAEAVRRKTEHVIHNEDGSISERHSYGNDPSERPG